MLKVTKFGGSSLADAAGFQRVKRIIESDPARRVVVVSAPGKRHPSDHKLTDLLYLCHAHLQYGVSCRELWRRICERCIAIRDGCALQTPVEQELDAIYAELSAVTRADALASRGEYLSARMMADYLGFTFVDAKDWLQFDYHGAVLREASYAALASAADGRKIVTPGFYGALPGGELHTFSRGGSDVTGALAAAALNADLYENWTDVPGVLEADPKLIPEAQSVPRLSYRQLALLSEVGTQVLHESAVAPVREKQIPMRICSTLQPELPGTFICTRPLRQPEKGVLALTGQRGLAMLRIFGTEVCPEKVTEVLKAAGVAVFSRCLSPGEQTLLLKTDSAFALHGAVETLRQSLPADTAVLRENCSVLAALHEHSDALPGLLHAVEAAGVPVHHLLRCPPLSLLLLNDSQYETALRAAYDARSSEVLQ